LTITNAYSHLINPLDDYGSGFNFTNRWGIYQAGASDKNYFAANSLFGSTTDTGERVQITGTAKVTALSLSGWNFALEGTGPSALTIRTPASGRYLILSRQDAANRTGNFLYLALSNGDSRFAFSSTDYFGDPPSSTLVQMRSTTQGFQPPTMTTAQKNAIGSPVAGLIVYDTTLNKLCVYTTAWETITSI
jgi:hypothetical protein